MRGLPADRGSGAEAAVGARPGLLARVSPCLTAWLALLAWALTASALHRRLVLIARAGHEVRGPLCTARLALGALERSARVEAIDLELRRAALALDDLSASRRPAGRREVVDVGRLLAECAPAWQALAEARGGGLTLEAGAARVVGDRLRLAQACANLVSNAVEHGGGTVSVRSWTAGGRARIEVADTGPGLPAPLPALLTAARGRRSPRGHGLAIAAAVAEGHGGGLTTAPSHHGTRLVLDLPAAPATTRVPRRSPPPHRPRPPAAAAPSSPSAASGSSIADHAAAAAPSSPSAASGSFGADRASGERSSPTATNGSSRVDRSSPAAARPPSDRARRS